MQGDTAVRIVQRNPCPTQCTDFINYCIRMSYQNNVIAQTPEVKGDVLGKLKEIKERTLLLNDKLLPYLMPEHPEKTGIATEITSPVMSELGAIKLALDYLLERTL